MAGMDEDVLLKLLRRFCYSHVSFEHTVSVLCTIHVDGTTGTRLCVKDTLTRQDPALPGVVDKVTQTTSDLTDADIASQESTDDDDEEFQIKIESEDVEDNALIIQPHSPGPPTSDPGNTSWDVEIICPLCPQHCLGQLAIESHLKSHHDIGNVYVCTICHDVCMSNSALIDHVTEKHSTGVKRPVKKGKSRKNEPKKVVVSKTKPSRNVQSKGKVTKSEVMKENCGNHARSKEQTDKTKIKLKIARRKTVKQKTENKNTDKVVSAAKVIIDNSFVPEIGQSQVKCAQCGKIYSSKRALRRHFSIVHDQTEYPCDECGKKFTGKESLYHHKRGIHMGLQPYKCQEPGCSAAFNFNHSLRLHTLKHSGSRPHMCTTCGKTYLTGYHLKVHVEATHSEEKKFACSTCNKTFSYSTSLKMHEATHKKALRVNCDKCDKTFVNSQALKFHMMTKHASEDEQTMCTLCDKVYPSELALRAHMRRHSSAGKRFMCDVCGGQFMFRSALEMHKAIHRDEKAFTCNICNKSFKTYPTLYSHQFVHKKDSPFQCGQCGKAFKTKERCKAHERRHSGAKPFKCDICSHCFPDNGGLSKHMRTVHCSVKKFVCEICGKATSRADNLRVHMKVHNKPAHKAKGSSSPTTDLSGKTRNSSWGDLPTVVPATLNTDFPNKEVKNKHMKVEQLQETSLEESNISTGESSTHNCAESSAFESNLPHFASLDAPINSDYQAIPLNLHTTTTIASNTDNNNINSSNSMPVPAILHLPQIGHQQLVSLPLPTEVSQVGTSGSVNAAANLHSLQPAPYIYPWPYIQGGQNP